MNLWQRLRDLRNPAKQEPEPLPYVDPLRAGRHPFQIYMLGLCVVSGLPYLAGYATAEAVEKQLPVWLALSWGILLLVGASLALLGSYWPRSIADALTMERVGLALTGGAALVYTLCVLGARSGLAPFSVVLMYVGYVLLRIPVDGRGWSPSKERIVGDLLTVLGLMLIFGCAVVLVLSPARLVLVGASIIFGFGVSCMRRAGDIAQIFHRANDPNPPAVRRETEV